jgi:hypothetical protein
MTTTIGRVQLAIARAFFDGRPTITREDIGCSRYTLPLYARTQGILWPIACPKGAPHHYRWTERTEAWAKAIMAAHESLPQRAPRPLRQRQKAANQKLSHEEWLARHDPRKSA